MVTGPKASGEGGESVQTNRETTIYLRYGNLLIRVTAALPKGDRHTYDIPLAEAVAVGSAVGRNAGGSLQELDQTCQ
jgi:hypothetical protein